MTHLKSVLALRSLIAIPDTAVAWVHTLTARGVSLQVKGKRLTWNPGTAYNSMSNDERQTYKQHKDDIIAVIREQYGGLARGAPQHSDVEQAGCWQAMYRYIETDRRTLQAHAHRWWLRV